MTPFQLKELGRLGWIVGPEESEAGFVKRIDIQRTFSEESLESITKHPAIIDFIESQLHVRPFWIQVRYSNDRLTPWQAAASWITKNGNWIQLRKSFKKGHFFGYQRDDVILHEAIHSLRFTFEEPQFEEILAYAFTKKKWRRYFGPLFFTTRQAYIFLIALLFTPFIPILPCFYFLYRLGRLVRNQWVFKKALQKIQKIFPNSSPYSIALRLTDREIQLFAIQEYKVIKAYIKSQEKDLRWQQLLANLA